MARWDQRTMRAVRRRASASLPEIQRILLSGFHTYTPGTGHAIRPVLTGFGPFDPISLDDSGALITAANLATALKTELWTDGSLSGKVDVAGSYTRITPSGLTNRWPLNEASGTTAADIVGGQDGTRTSGAISSSFPPGVSSLRNSVSASFSKIVTALAGQISRNFTITFWADATGYAGSDDYSTAVSQSSSGGWLIGFKGTTRQFGITTPGVSSIAHDPDELPDGWQFCAVTVSAGATATYKVYVNGVEKASGTSSVAIPSASDVLVIAANAGGVIDFWFGKLSDVQLFNRELSASEIADIYAGDSIVLDVTFDASLGNVPEMTIGGQLSQREEFTVGGATDESVQYSDGSDSGSTIFDQFGAVTSAGPPLNYETVGVGTGSSSVTYRSSIDGPRPDQAKTSGGGGTVTVDVQGLDPITADVETIQDGG